MNKLAEIIKSEIRDKTQITFAQFMELALYDPGLGYYRAARANIGKEGDFYTSPHVHSAFGHVIGKFVLKSFDLLGKDSLAVIEIGAGKGFLALDILDYIKAHSESDYEGLTYYIVEKNSSYKNHSSKLLNNHSDRIKWLSALEDLNDRKTSGVVISNELFDALPFHRLKYTNGNVEEIYVTIKNGELVETTDELSSESLDEYIKREDIDFKEGQEFEINLNSETLLGQIDTILDKGFILTIDYGYLAPELFSPDRMKGTYKCLHKHQINEKPYINIGEQDITAHVDFSNLIAVGEALGLKKVCYTTQGQFLIDWGILDIINNNIKKNKKHNVSLEKDINAIKNLFLPELMGDKFKVLIQQKMDSDVVDFYPESPLKISFNVL